MTLILGVCRRLQQRQGGFDGGVKCQTARSGGGQEIAAHVGIPESLQVIGDPFRGPLLALRSKEFRHLVRHIGELFIRFHDAVAIRPACVKTSKESSRAIATSVMPAPSAARKAKFVGAETATSIGQPIAAAFCTSSMESRLDSTMNPPVA